MAREKAAASAAGRRRRKNLLIRKRVIRESCQEEGKEPFLPLPRLLYGI
jgi:hypothetical protein